LNGSRKFQSEKNYPPFSKGGQGGLCIALILPLNHPLKKGDFTLQLKKTLTKFFI
jgi:hypothetical protein